MFFLGGDSKISKSAGYVLSVDGFETTDILTNALRVSVSKTDRET
jgi:hypothetical protein